MKPKVSVIMPCFNHAQFVADSISSILKQSYHDFELIVVDDGSKDESGQVIIEFAKCDDRVVPILRSTNGGEAKSRNDAMRKAQGELISFCDSDDLWEPHKLDIQVKHLMRHTNIGFLHGDSILINEIGVPTGQQFSSLFPRGCKLRGEAFFELCVSNHVNVPTVMIRCECVAAAGFFEEEFTYLTDWVYWTKVARRARFDYIATPLAKYRIHSRSTSKNRKEYSKYRAEAYAFFLKRFDAMPRLLQAEMEYLAGVSALDAGEQAKARLHFLNALVRNPAHIKAFARAVAASVST